MNTLAWGLPVLTAALAAGPPDHYFLVNFAVALVPPFVVLFVLSLLDLRQPEFVATAGALAALPIVFMAMHGQWWFGSFACLPGFIAGTLLTLAWSRRHTASSKSIFIAVVAPYVGVAVEMLLFDLIGRL